MRLGASRLWRALRPAGRRPIPRPHSEKGTARAVHPSRTRSEAGGLLRPRLGREPGTEEREALPDASFQEVRRHPQRTAIASDDHTGISSGETLRGRWVPSYSERLNTNLSCLFGKWGAWNFASRWSAPMSKMQRRPS